MKLSMETEEAEKENKIYKAVKVNEKPKRVDTKQTGEWKTAEEYVPEPMRSKAETKSEKSEPEEARPASKESSENAEFRMFFNRESLGNLDDAKALKLSVPALDLEGKAPEKDPKKEFTFGPLQSSLAAKKKDGSTLKTGKWEKAEPYPQPSKGDHSLLEEF